MKRIYTLILVLFCFSVTAQKTPVPQTSYYKGEWSRTGSAFNYSAIVKLVVTGTKVEGEIVWKLVSGDSLNSDTYPYYKKLTGLTAIEKISGELDPKTNDLIFKGTAVVDPNQIIGMDEYLLKWAYGKKAIYGRTSSNGRWTGSFYAIRLASATEYTALVKTVKKRTN